MKTEELTELKIGEQSIPAIKGADVLVCDRFQSTFGIIEKITSGWGGTVYVRTSINSVRKFDKRGYERSSNAWHPTSILIMTPEQKAERIRKQKEEQDRMLKASRLNNLKWYSFTTSQIDKIYNLAIALEILK